MSSGFFCCPTSAEPAWWVHEAEEKWREEAVMPIVTIGQQIGSGPRLAPVIAEQLGVPCYDDEIVTRAARRAGCSVASFRKMDERPPSRMTT